MTPQRPPPRITPQYLENAALHYLERFASSSVNLERVLKRKVARSLAHWGGAPETAAAQIAAVIEKLTRLGYLDDAQYAAAKAASLHRRGKAARVIRATLSAKGVAAPLAEAAAAEGDDRAAAIRLAQRRRLGPFAPPEKRADCRRRDLGVMVRAGFSYDIAQAVIDAATAEDLAEE